MRVFQCRCGNKLFFGNTLCLKCKSEVGYCPVCDQLTSIAADESGVLHCGNPECQQALQKCRNYAVEQVCNCCVEFNPDQPDALCPDCRLTTVIPNLEVPGNRELWARLEDAKRRVLRTLRMLKLPIGTPENEDLPKLVFDFAADLDTPVFTGHDNGRITINIREADDVERERARVAFQEPQRTLVGHFRHELGHYYWDLLIKGQREEECREFFGDERDPTYDVALNNYYQNGPLLNWQTSFVSAYASMHPWEDFAETFGTYLDMISILESGKNRTGDEFRKQSCEKLLKEYQVLGTLANELNREMGLKDLVPEVFSPDVVKKLCYIHQLVANSASRTAPTSPQSPPVVAQPAKTAPAPVAG